LKAFRGRIFTPTFHLAAAMSKHADSGLTIERVKGDNFQEFLLLVESLPNPGTFKGNKHALGAGSDG
jgi:hypothetical protein